MTIFPFVASHSKLFYNCVFPFQFEPWEHEPWDIITHSAFNAYLTWFLYNVLFISLSNGNEYRSRCQSFSHIRIFFHSFYGSYALAFALSFVQKKKQWRKPQIEIVNCQYTFKQRRHFVQSFIYFLTTANASLQISFAHSSENISISVDSIAS